MKINFYNETNDSVDEYISLINSVLKRYSKRKSMNVIFMNDKQILELNKQYRNKNYVTDVISFPNDKKELGDIFICINQAKRQASEYKHSVSREVGFLATHGYLHLKGFDHLTKEDEEVMINLQKKILKKAKLERNLQ